MGLYEQDWKRLAGLCAACLLLTLLAGCGKVPTRVSNYIKTAAQLVCEAPNEAYAAMIEKTLAADADAQETWQADLEAMCGEALTPDCMQKLHREGILGFFARRAFEPEQEQALTVVVNKVSVERVNEAGAYLFEAEVTATVDGQSMEGTVTGNAQCLEQDEEKISSLQVRFPKELQEFVGYPAQS